MSLSFILMLVIGLALPIINDQVLQYILNLLGYFGLGFVADKFVHGPPFANHVHQGPGKVSISFHTVDITEFGVQSGKELCTCRTIINCWGIRVDRIGGNGFVSSCNVLECRKWSSMGIVDVSSDPSGTCILGSDGEGLAYNLKW